MGKNLGRDYPQGGASYPYQFGRGSIPTFDNPHDLLQPRLCVVERVRQLWECHSGKKPVEVGARRGVPQYRNPRRCHAGTSWRLDNRGVKGEVYPCKPDIFEATYEPWLGHPAYRSGHSISADGYCNMG